VAVVEESIPMTRSRCILGAQQPERRRTCASVCMDAGILEKAGIFRLGVGGTRFSEATTAAVASISMNESPTQFS
jgi:hypothetical protein